MTFENIVETIKKQACNHPLINTVIYGSMSQINIESNVNYPLVLITPGSLTYQSNSFIDATFTIIYVEKATDLCMKLNIQSRGINVLEEVVNWSRHTLRKEVNDNINEQYVTFTNGSINVYDGLNNFADGLFGVSWIITTQYNTNLGNCIPDFCTC